MKLGDFPTPANRLDALSAKLKGEIWVKRDDLTAGLYGGNKVRKLEFILADCLQRGCDGTWTVGGEGSHHLLAVARFAASEDLRTYAATFPQPLTMHTLQVKRALSREQICLFPSNGFHDFPLAVFKLLKTANRENKSLYRISAGGSCSLGVLGYVSAALELAEQVKQGVVPAPDVIVVALGSCSTAAGLLLGLEIAGLTCAIHAVRVTSSAVANRFNIYRLAWDAALLLARLGVPAVEILENRTMKKGSVKLHIAGEQLGGGYGHFTRSSKEAERLLIDLEELRLDPTYTGKAVAHLIDRCNKVVEKKTQCILYWHTLGKLEKESGPGENPRSCL